MKNDHQILLGDCEKVLNIIPNDSVNLIFTSPPYADQRRKTYGGIHHEKYVEWFLPKSKEFLRVLKPSGTFVLNIKEKVVQGERSTYVMVGMSRTQTDNYLKNLEKKGILERSNDGKSYLWSVREQWKGII